MITGRKIRVGIIGYGRSGANIHGVHLLTDDRFEVVAVCDFAEGRRKAAERDFGCATYDDYKEMAERTDIDLFINATTSSSHYTVAKYMLSKGKNLISEKPAAKTAQEVKDLVETAKANGCSFAFYQQSRNAPYYLQAKKVADSGVLGRIVFVRISFDGFGRRWDWQTVQSKVAGNLYNTGPHPLDQALRFLDYDGDELQVFCHMDSANCYGDAEDFVKIELKAPGRPLVEVNISSASAYPDATYMIQGTNGSLSGDMNNMKWKYFDPAKAPERELVLGPMTDSEGNPVYCSETLDFTEQEWESAPDEKDLFKTISKRYYDMMYAHLAEGAEIHIKPEQAIQQIAVMQECHRQNPMKVIY